MNIDKVEEIVKEYDKTFGEWCPIYKKIRMPLTQADWLRTTLTQYHQDMMSEVVEKIETEIDRIKDGDIKWVGLRRALVIIKKLDV